MQLYLDSANLDHIRQAASLGIISGVTTNPSLLAKEDPNVDIKKRILEIHKLVGGHLSVEVISTDTKGMLKEADEILNWFPDATIKIPMIPAGLAAVSKLSEQGVPTNVTLVFSANQAIAAQNAGASYVSIFMGRLDDISSESNRVLEDICDIWDVQGYDSEIIAASIRNPIHLTQSALAGAHIATVPYNVLMQSLRHPLTDSGLKSFLDDYNKFQNEIYRLKSQRAEPTKVITPKQDINPKAEIVKQPENKHIESKQVVSTNKENLTKPVETQPVANTNTENLTKPVEAKPVANTNTENLTKPVEAKPVANTNKENLTKPAPKSNRRGGAKKKEASK